MCMTTHKMNLRMFIATSRPIHFICMHANMERYMRDFIPGHSPVDRHDITAHVFTQKLKSQTDFFVKHEVTWSVLCRMYTVQWQKRGLPDAHRLHYICTLYAQYDTWTLW